MLVLFYFHSQPLMFERLLCCNSFLRVDSQHLKNEVFALLWSDFPDSLFEIDFATFYRTDDVIVGVPIERRFSAQQDVENHT